MLHIFSQGGELLGVYVPHMALLFRCVSFRRKEQLLFTKQHLHYLQPCEGGAPESAVLLDPDS